MALRTHKPSGIATWSADDRPREKLLRLGAKHLSDSELLAVILRIGVKGNSAIDLGQEIKTRFKTWRNITDVDIAEWKQIKGLGLTKSRSYWRQSKSGKGFNPRSQNKMY